jgi:hypothetical protein
MALNPWSGPAVGQLQSYGLTPEQIQAQDPTYAAAHPAEAAQNRVYNPFSESGGFGYRLGAGLRDIASRPNILGSILNQGPMAGGALGAGIGALAGAGIGAATGRGTGNMALLGALLAGGLGAYSGHVRTTDYSKSAGWRSSAFGDPKEAITTALQQAPMEFNQKMQVLAGVSGLSPDQADQLARAIQSVGGMAAGGIIARYLLGWGLLGTLFGGAVGGMIGHNLYTGAHDAMGYKSLGNRDFSGNPTYL